MDDSLLERLPLDWAAWTLENLLRGVSPKDIRNVLTDAGYTDLVNEFDDSSDVDAFEVAKKAVRSLMTYREILVRRLRLRALLTPVILRQRFDPDNFYQTYYFKNEPVILTHLLAADSPLHQWSPQRFKQDFGRVEVEVQCGREKDPKYEINLDAHRTRMLLSEFVDLISSNGPSNDVYMCANNGTLQADLSPLLEEIPAIPDLLDAATNRGKSFLWFGPQGTITPFHYDILNVLLYQVLGEKKFVIAPPEATPFMYNDVGVFSKVDYFGDWSDFPLFRHVPLIVGVLKPGEALFIPVGWWHTIRAEETSISLSFTNFSHQNEFRKVSC